MALLMGSAQAVPQPIHYRLQVELDPPRHEIAVDAAVRLPRTLAGKRIEFLLASALDITWAKPAIRKIATTAGDGFTGINGSSVALGDAVGRYAVTVPRSDRQLRIRYRGAIHCPPQNPPQEYTRSFRETPGLLAPEGVYLAGSTLWYPFFGDELLTFTLEVNAPKGWHLIGAGSGTSSGADGRARWDSGGPLDEMHLVGGPLTRYHAPAGSVTAEVYLREADPALAARYLDATARYLEMYRGLIGPYPYGKFALVENFWETGYGMPSFTLLGPQIIRFPFILTSSYPHEILHNWWGNSVFVDYPTGNWAEGLTAYLADHLLKEQAGQGAEYRRDVLKKYRDFVAAGGDFPLAEFRSRHSAATEAVGYGKTLMGFHMLRQRLGDETFRKTLAAFYGRYRGRRASFADLQKEFEATGGTQLQRFFDEWVSATGAAELALEEVSVTGHTVRGLLRQRQARPFELDVPVVVFTAAGAVRHLLRSQSAATPFSLSAEAPPIAVAVDPEFDVFRLLDHRETAPSIGELFGAGELLAILPSAEDAASQASYRAMIDAWSGPSQQITVVTDAHSELPPGRSAWLFGRQNRLAARLFADGSVPGLAVEADALRTGDERIAFANHSCVIVRRHPQDPALSVGWIVVDPLQAASGLARKLPHYGKYSYLGFEGTEPVNRVKGEWPVADSPLQARLDARATLPPLPARRALTDPPPAFSRDRLLGHVRFLASPALEGRGLGSAGLEKAADYIAREFAAAGLRPGGADGWFQRLTTPTGPDGRPHEVRNVIGVVPGGETRFTDQAVLITAHYDHLGFGWPDARTAVQGAVYPGADDNASGIALLIELARSFAAQPLPPRTLVFVAFAAEEAGRLGSRHYVSEPRPVRRGGIRAVINLDTVGRLGAGPVQVLASGSASEWPHVFRGVSLTTGVTTRMVDGASQSSDQQSFIDVGIPAVQIFTGAHADYHRPTDTVDKVDVDGLVKVATVVREAARYLLARSEPLTFQGMVAPSAGQNSAARRISLGTVPDFAFPGPGVRVESVLPGSAAEQAGLRPGDILTALDGQSISDLAAYSQMLKRYAPGQRIRISGTRDGAPLEAHATLQSR